MSDASAQYEAYPYPERDPKDEAKRLVTGSPSHPFEIDHFVFGGKRDWTKPLRALVAGGGTGDALIQLAQVMTSAGRPYEITYLDLSSASRRIAEARAKARGLSGIRFVTDSLLNARDYGEFDYIDCCGVLHHLPEPQAGFDALARALAPGGGMGIMVYAPYGRSGVYPLQEAFQTLLDGLAPKERLVKARKIFERLPDGHPFKRNPHVSDHRNGDAGFYDLLLHSQDRPFNIRELADALDHSGLAMISPVTPGLYDPAPFLPQGVAVPEDSMNAMELAEKLRGTMKVHVVYAAHGARAAGAMAHDKDMTLVPHLKGVEPRALAAHIAKKGRLDIGQGAEKVTLDLPKAAAPFLGAVNGRRSLTEIARMNSADPIRFASVWRPAARALSSYGMLLYSSLLV